MFPVTLPKPQLKAGFYLRVQIVIKVLSSSIITLLMEVDVCWQEPTQWCPFVLQIILNSHNEE